MKKTVPSRFAGIGAKRSKRSKCRYEVIIRNELSSLILVRCEEKTFEYVKTYTIEPRSTVIKYIRQDTLLAVWCGNKLIGGYTLPSSDEEGPMHIQFLKKNARPHEKIQLTVTESGLKIYA